MTDSLKAEDIKPIGRTMGTGKSFLPLGDFQFFAKKKEEDDPEEEEELEEEEEKEVERKSKREEDAPAWAKTFMSTIQEVIKPKEQEQDKVKVPVPEAPVVEEEEQEEEKPPQEGAMKRFLRQLW